MFWYLHFWRRLYVTVIISVGIFLYAVSPHKTDPNSVYFTKSIVILHNMQSLVLEVKNKKKLM